METDLTVNGEAEQHEEEEGGEQLRHRHRHQRLWVHDEHQSRTCREREAEIQPDVGHCLGQDTMSSV